jgi:hypothetical protein
MFTRRRPETLGLLALASFGASAADRQSLDDAWWTGPILAAGAATLPQGRVLVEPYVFDVIRTGRFDREGERQSASRAHSYRSLTYLLYGVTDKLTVGLIPVFGFNEAGDRSSAVQPGDLTVQAQYRLSQFREGGWLPTTSVVVQQSLPIGGSALSTGAYTTTIALRSQYYLWMPSGRIMRTRFHVSYAAADEVAAAGDVMTINSSWEYSITRNWVFALDFVYQHDDDTDSGSAWRAGIAPAIEYNWSGSVGVIVGARSFVAGRNTNATLTPMVAINVLF